MSVAHDVAWSSIIVDHFLFPHHKPGSRRSRCITNCLHGKASFTSVPIKDITQHTVGLRLRQLRASWFLVMQFQYRQVRGAPPRRNRAESLIAQFGGSGSLTLFVTAITGPSASLRLKRKPKALQASSVKGKEGQTREFSLTALGGLLSALMVPVRAMGSQDLSQELACGGAKGIQGIL